MPRNYDNRNTEDIVQWRNGAHILGTSIWCDATRVRDICFVSAAHASGVRSHGQLIATQETIEVLSSNSRKESTKLPVPYGRPFTVGTSRLELIQSGHSLGSASLSINVEGHRILYAGAVSPKGKDLGGSADLRNCSTLVVAAPYSIVEFPKRATIIENLLAFCTKVQKQKKTPLLLVSSESKALDVAHILYNAGFQISANHRIARTANCMGKLDARIPAIRRVTRSSAPEKFDNQVVIWPCFQRKGIDELQVEVIPALVSGLACDPNNIKRYRVKESFAWSNFADLKSLKKYIQESGAKSVYLTMTDEIPPGLQLQGLQVRTLGPAWQLSLF